eukprot:403356888
MSDNIKEDKDGEYGLLSSKVERFLDDKGKLTQEFKDELREFKEEELINLEESIKNARQPSEDMFGIKRRFCSVCLKGCIGYEPINMIVPSQGGTNMTEFPTFCKNCKCPAYFHQVVFDREKDLVFPPELSETIKNYNIRSKDINFNCVIAVFQVRDTEKYQNNLNELLTIIKEDGLEVLQMEKRDLDVEEAIYFKTRMVGQAENQVTKILGISDQNLGKIPNIRQEAYQGSSMQTKTGAKDPYIMNQFADEKEKKLQKMQQTMINQKSNQNMHYVQGITLQKNIAPDQNQYQHQQQNNNRDNKGLLMESINQRVPLNMNQSQQDKIYNRGGNNQNNGAASIARTSNVDSIYNQNKNQFIDTMALSKRETVLPMGKDKYFKVKTFSKTSTQIKKTLSKPTDLASQELYLTQQVESNPLLRELITKEVLILALGSATFQNLDSKLKSIMVKVQQFVPPYEMPMLYLSDNKILALEDSITFFPSLFRMTKSIVITEQLVDFNNYFGDASSYVQVQLGQNDANSKHMNEKLQELMQDLDDGDRTMAVMQDPNRDIQDQLDEDEDEGFYRNRKTLTRKISSQLREAIIKRETIINAQQSKQFTKLEESNKDDTILEWIKKSKQQERKNKKKQRLLTKKNKNLFNYGIMQDFFSYSAMSIQYSHKEVDIDYQKMQQATTTYKNAGLDGAMPNQLRGSQNLANIYAIAKTGLSNLILPNALDLKLSNYNNYVSYTRLSDMFFPELSKSNYSVLVMRPIIVKNGLNEQFIQILKVNDFTIIKRKVRMLLKSEVMYLAEVEKVTKDQAEIYYNLMMDGDCEIIVVSKLGAVEDLQSLVDGCKPFGRRRIPQLFEDQSSVRQNVDSINGMFEITPFTSFSEFIDLEDFIVGHTKLEKYKKLFQTTKESQANRLENQLYFYKIDQIRRELNLFQRFFNVAALASPSLQDAQKQMCILMPEVATIEESVIILNPLYNVFYEQANRLLERMGFRIIKHKLLHIRPEEVEKIFDEKLSGEYKDYTHKLRETIAKEQALAESMKEKSMGMGQTGMSEFQRMQTMNQSERLLKTYGNQTDRLTDLLSDTQVHMFHICKIAGDREIRQLYKDSQVEYTDLFKMKLKTTPFRVNQFPLLFIFMDTPLMFEEGLKMIYPISYVEVTGQDFQDRLKQAEKFEVLNNALISTIGDEIKSLIFDKEGKILNGLTEDELNSYSQTDKIPQVFQLFSNPKGNHAIHFLVESESHGLYEIRFQRLPQRGDYYSEANEADKVNLNNLKVRYFTKFQAQNFYYNEVNKRFYNICPAFYRFKICPLITKPTKNDCINRVYEVEEYMGKLFIEDLSNQHQDHIRMQKQNQVKIGWQFLTEDQQQSLPPYIWGVRICSTVKDLEKVMPYKDQVTGAGKLKFEKGELKGQCADPNDYYQQEKLRYEKILKTFKNGWGYYLNAIDQEIIETKLAHILGSFTFKYSRQPGMMALIPDRITETNLRISEKIKFLIPEALDRTNKEKFFTHLKEDLINADSENLRSREVQSVLHTLHVANVKKTLDKSKQMGDIKTEDGKKSLIINKENVVRDPLQDQKFSVHKDVAIVGVEVAIRTRYQLIASILYLFNFWYRKVERRTEFFEDLERQFIQKHPEGVDPERDYDQILDIIVRSIQENYGEDEYNYALDMAKLTKEEESEFERGMREKHEKLAKQFQRLEQKKYDEKRLMRTTMSIEKLIETQCNIPQYVYEAEQRLLLKKFVESRGHNDSAGEGFLALLSQSDKVRYGPYSIKLAHDYLKRFEKAENSKQEKISFVKMEYFLYGINESFRIVEELRAMESKLVGLLDDMEIKKRQAGFNQDGTSTNFQNTTTYASMGTDNSKLTVIQDLEKKIDKVRYQIAAKEAELVMSFRELASWDYMVPDHYFDVNYLIKMKNMRSETYQIPFKTFWLPINIEGVTGVYEPELTMEKFALRIRDYSEAPRLPLTTLYREADEPIPDPKKKEGALISYLRPYNNRDPSDYLRFDKYYSMGEWKQYREIIQVRDLIKEKTTKQNFTYGQKFMQ